MRAKTIIWTITILLALAWHPVAAQEEPAEDPQTAEGALDQQAEDDDVLEEVPDDQGTQYGGYPEEPRIVGGPTDVSVDLATSFPKKDSVFGGVEFRRFFKWKERLYDKTGIKLGISYQAMYQKFSDTTNDFPLPTIGQDWASGGWLLIEGKWDMINKGKDWQGGITAALDWRHEFGDVVPIFSQSETGSLWPTDFTLDVWDPWFAQLYWEQWGKKDSFMFRVGTQVAPQYLDFFRFKDGRTAFSSAQMTSQATTMPFPGPGLGVMFETWPIKDSPLYVIGTMNDMNFEGGSFSWHNAFEYGQFFYALEVGAHIGDFPRNFDHVHLTLFYSDGADGREVQVGDTTLFPNKAGWGFRVAGEKQWDRIVGFANYGYNTAEGGAFGITLGRHGLNVGMALQRPFEIRGEVAVGASWVHPIQQFETGLPDWNNRRDQYAIETYWKILLTPDLWITPNVQMIWHPSFNEKDFIWIGGLKFRWFI